MALYRDNTENLQALPVTSGWPASALRVVYSVGPLAIPAGVIVDVKFQAEVTNDVGHVVGIGRKVIRTNNPSATEGTVVVPACFEYITPEFHHKVLVHAAAEEIAQSLNNVYYNAVLYAVADRHNPGDALKVEQGYGCLIIELRRPS